ncbi:battenin CLN3 protein [Actinomortierella wolfii]|nr:battenin CLN3 protein [Actinomortierella wolfii]
MPSLVIKSIAPYFIHKIIYPVRIIVCASLSITAVTIIGLSDSVPIRIVGVMMASLSSGLGELTFLMLSSFYRIGMVTAWSSGTGGAGLIGAFLFLALTSWIGLSVTTSLGVVAVFPILLLFAYFVLLGDPEDDACILGYEQLITAPSGNTTLHDSYQSQSPSQPQSPPPPHSATGASSPATTLTIVPESTTPPASITTASSATITGVPTTLGPPSIGTLPTAPTQAPTSINALLGVSDSSDEASRRAALNRSSTAMAMRESGIYKDRHPRQASSRLAARGGGSAGGGTSSSSSSSLLNRHRHASVSLEHEEIPLWEKLQLAKSLIQPFMGPLFLVYFAEYTMNQGVLPVVLFPLEQTPFHRMRDHYVTYSAIYQLGVFISRTLAGSDYFLPRLDNLWIPSLLQLLNLALVLSHALIVGGWIPTIGWVFVLILWEGLLGGTTYVHTYLGLSREFHHDPKGKEFAMGVVGVADGLGITLAGLCSLWLEPVLCHDQVVRQGIELCQRMAD